MLQKLTSKQQWVYDYLTARSGQYVSPSEIGKAYRRAKGQDHSWYTSSDYSSVGSDACRALMRKNFVLRSNKGHYKAVLGSSHQSSPTVAKPISAEIATPNVAGTAKTMPVRDPEEARRAYNAANGYIFVAKLSNGTEMYKKQNTDGKTWTYYNQQGAVYNMIWNEMICTKEELVTIAKDCYQMGHDIIVTAATGTGYKYTIGQLIFYMKDNLLHSAKVIDKDSVNGLITYRTIHGVFEESRCYASKEALIATM